MGRDLRYYWRGTAVLSRTWAQISEFKPDVIYERSAFMSDAGLRAARRLGVPLFFESDGHLVDTYASLDGVFSTRLAWALERRKARAARRVVVMADSAISATAERLGQPAEKFVVKRLGVDATAFSVDQTLRAKVFQEHNLTGKFVVGFVAGLLQSYHGLPLLLDAMRMLRESHPQIVAFVIGGGSLFESLTAVRTGGIANVVFRGLVPKEQIASYMAGFDVAVVPDCVPHMFPIKLLEYGLLGACPLVPRYPAFEEVLPPPSFPGAYFEPHDAKALATAMAALADSADTARATASRWHGEVLGKHTWDRAVVPVLAAMEAEAQRP